MIAEGFLLFFYPAMLALDAVRIFIDLDHEELERRRACRARQPGDAAQGGKRLAVESSWGANGLQEWQRFGAGQAELPGVQRLDGRRDGAELAGQIAGIWWWANQV